MNIEPKYIHSKFGNVMFNLCAKFTKFLVKHRVLYYLLACTWGIIMTALGWAITLVLVFAALFTRNIAFQKYHWIYSISVGPEYWGGFEMGLMFVRDQLSSSSHIDTHEFGHTFQNCLFGPLMPFLVSIPSACRWWARMLFPNKKFEPYDAFWVEDAASQCGLYAHYYLNNKEAK